MVSKRVTNDKPASVKRPPATTPQSRENQLIAAAVDLAEQQLRDGTASAQVMTHYLKLGSSRERLEQERILMEVGLMGKKRELMESGARIEELYEGAINAMRAYNGQEPLTTASEELDD